MHAGQIFNFSWYLLKKKEPREPFMVLMVHTSPCVFPIEQFLRLKESQKWAVRGFPGWTVRSDPGFKTLVPKSLLINRVVNFHVGRPTRKNWDSTYEMRCSYIPFLISILFNYTSSHIITFVLFASICTFGTRSCLLLGSQNMNEFVFTI